MGAFFVLLVIILIGVAFWLVSVYNQLQSKMQDIREQLSNLQAALKKRTDLTAQIVDIAKSYGDHEKIAYLTVTQGNQALNNLRVLSQNYPALQANQTYQQLMDKLEGLENLILQRREVYNAKVKSYNSLRNRFPAVMIAQKLSFGVAPYYEIEDPDFIEKVKIFERDDSEVLQQLVHSSSQALGHKVQSGTQALGSKVQAGAAVLGAKAQETQTLIREKLDERTKTADTGEQVADNSTVQDDAQVPNNHLADETEHKVDDAILDKMDELEHEQQSR